MLDNCNNVKVTKRWLQYVATITVSLATLIGGMNFGWPSPALPKYYSGNESVILTPEEGSWIASVNLASDIFGAPLAAYSADLFGRKSSIAFTAIPYFIAWLLIAFADSFAVICIAKVLFGIGAGFSYSLVPIYIGEISDNDIRGTLGSSIGFTSDCGILLIYIIGSATSILVSSLIVAVFPVILLVLILWMPESPYYYLMKNNVDSAEQSLKRLRGRDDVTDELCNMKSVVNEQMSKPTSLLELFKTKSNLKALYICMGLKSAQMLCGIAAFLTYAQLIYEKIGGDLIAPSNTAIVFGVVQLTSITIASAFVDRIGRKPLLILSSIGTGVCVTVISIYFYLLEFTEIDVSQIFLVPIMFSLIFVLMYSIGLGPLVFLMPGELFPSNIKAKAVSALDLYIALNGFLVIKLYQTIATNYGTFVPFTIFAIVCFSSAVFVYVCVPETKGKPFEEIQDWLKNIETVPKKDFPKNTETICL